MSSVFGIFRICFSSMTVLVFSLWGIPGAAADPWPIKEFDVIAVWPLDGNPEEQSLLEYSADVYRRFQEGGFIDEYIPPKYDSREINPTVKAAIESFLHDAAVQMEEWGFPPPALKPVVKNFEGRDAYRVYLIASLGPSPAKYLPDCEGTSDRIILLDHNDVLMSTFESSVDYLTPRGLEYFAHELFHAVQYNSRFYRCVNGRQPVGSWITEGQANAIGWDLAVGLRPVSYEKHATSRWGNRDYSVKLPVNAVKRERHVSPYGTSSLWRYFAERMANIHGPRPGPEQNPVDYSYLSSMLDTQPVSRDCIRGGDPCEAEVDWLNSQLQAKFRQPLREIYTNFLEAMSLYGEYRPGLKGLQDWQDRVFDMSSCKKESFHGKGPYKKGFGRFLDFEPVSGRCIGVEFKKEDFQEIDKVQVELKLMTKNDNIQLKDLTAAVADKPIRSFLPEILENQETGERSATWIFDLPVEEMSYLVISNIADIPSESKEMVIITYNITVLKEYSSMGESGPSASDIDAPLPFELDTVNQSYVIPGTSHEHVKNGLQDVCNVQFAFSDSRTGDGLMLKMDIEGPLRPGTYSIHDGGPLKSAEFPGMFAAGFNIGHGNALGQGFTLPKEGVSGTVTLDEVSKHLITGRATIVGEAKKLTQCKSPAGDTGYYRPRGNQIQCPGPENMVIQAKFGVIPKTTPGYSRLGKSIDQCFTFKPIPPPTIEDPNPEPDPDPDPEPDPESPAPGPPPGTPLGEPATPATSSDADSDPTPTDPSETPSGDSVSLPDGKRWAIIRAHGDFEAVVIMDQPQFVGGCNGSTPLEFSLVQGRVNDPDLIMFSFKTDAVLSTGQTGVFTVSDIKWDYGTISPPNIPSSLNIRVPNRFEGAGGLTLSTHNATSQGRRMEGVVSAPGMHDRQGQSVDVTAEFRVDWSCGVEPSG